MEEGTPSATKLCNGPCGLARPLREFSVNRRNGDGLESRCRACRSAGRRAAYVAKPAREPHPGPQSTKLCSRCGPVVGPKPREAFSPDARHPDGLQSRCRECYNAARAERLRDPKKRSRVRARDRARYARDPVKRRKASANAPSKQPEARRARNKARYDADPAAANAASRAYYQAHLEDQRAAGRRRSAARYAANPEAWKDKNSRRRARLRSGEVEPVNLREVWIRDRGVCQICRRKVNRRLRFPHPKSRSWDHIVPLSKGGAHKATNLRLTHLSCNVGRGARPGAAAQLLLL